MRIKYIIAVLLIALTIILTSCPTTIPTQEDTQETTTTPITSQATTPAETTQVETEPISSSIASTTLSTLEPLAVHFIDVGQGDSILIDHGQTEILIDGGDRSPGVVTYLSSYVDGELEVMVATHPHADHIGGLIAVLQSFDVKEIWHNGDTSTSTTYQDFMEGVNSEGAEVHVARLHDVIDAGDLSLKVHHPANLEGSTNNNSIVLHLAYGEVDFLFMGDAEQEAESNMMMLDSLPVPEVEVLKVGHHGSRTASSPDFLAITSPEVAIYMAGEGNTYGHPHEETISALNDIGAMICGTDALGTIVVITNGKTYTIRLENMNLPVTPDSEQPSTTTSEISPPTTTTTPSILINVKITKIFFDGVVYRTESDEYVEITNQASEPVDLEGWVLRDVSEGYPSFTFPSYTLQPYESIRVYTNEIHPEYGGFSFGSGKAVWNNSDPDTAVLYDSQGNEVSRASY